MMDWKYVKVLPLAVVLLLEPSVLYAEGSRIVGYEPNYLIFAKREGNDLDDSLRANLSFKYEFTGVPFLKWKPNRSLHFTYNGAFDFYWNCGDCRESDPVVNRIFNPALHWRFYRLSGRYLEISLHHRSNGQTVDALVPDRKTGGLAAVSAFDRGDNAYIDSISRSMNYVQLEAGLKPSNNSLLYVRWRPRFYEQENLVTWRGAVRAADFANYDRFEFIYSHNFSDKVRLQANWSIGDRGFSTDSLDIGLQYNRWGLPIYLNAHFGPMETLSDHTRSVNYLGLGVVFWEIGYRKPSVTVE